ncbi:hypothetical protein QCD70_15490 [Agreia sp. PsM10]|uniref:hypothetical protein n=1 Tax=Agreia sp. PsM10 TaxID=3030533 RepID=UPI00263A94D8|nr:hypothetical protein [Agreia sp. PsM10]MDN4641655.1 hypothetical protein [Agreia sp. PsM10]
MSRFLTDRIAWDIDVADFRDGGNFDHMVRRLQTENFDLLVERECREVAPFLHAWEAEIRSAEHWPGLGGGRNLETLFQEAPVASGVLYISRNHTISESFFQDVTSEKTHLTDRVVHPSIRDALAVSHDLTFSFPRTYTFDGYVNSWGFIRIDRELNDARGAGVLLSVTTLDPEVMRLLQTSGFEHVVELYDHAWDHAIHDYLHHIALYTNPSFGIGKLSPMSLAAAAADVESWGADMMSTFNYEYWAHRTHRSLTAGLLTSDDHEAILTHAIRYFEAVASFVETIGKGHNNDPLSTRLWSYLSSIYLWPLHIVVHPMDSLFEKIGDIVNGLQHPDTERLRETLGAPLRHLQAESEESRDPRIMGLRGVVRDILGTDDLNDATHLMKLSWFDLLRIRVEFEAQRGLYEGWYHDEPIMFAGRPVSATKTAKNIIEHVDSAVRSVKARSHSLGPYKLKGIVP